MTKIRLLVHSDQTAPVLDAVQRAEAVELTPVEDQRLNANDVQQADLHRQSARLDFAVEFLREYAQAKKGLRKMVEGEEVYTTQEEVEYVVRTFYADEIVEKAQNLQKKLNDLGKNKKELLKEYEELESWAEVPLTVGADLTTATTTTFWLKRSGRLPDIRPHKDLNDKLKSVGIISAIMIVDERHILLTVFVDQGLSAEQTAKTLNYETVKFAQRRGTPAEERERIVRRLKKIDEMTDEYARTAQILANEHLPQLKIISDYLLWQKERSDVAGGAPRTSTCAVFEGWCPEKSVDKIRQIIKKQTKMFSLTEVAPRKGEAAPVEIFNSGLARPFEAVTRLYGLPGNKDLDPTPYLAGFFFIFFGFCLTDVGYGMILATLTGFILWRYRVRGATKTLIQLLFLGGIASLLMGVIFSGYMGIDTSRLPQFLQKMALFDPLNNPIPVFYVALALGVIHILFGLILSIVRCAKNGNLLEGVLDHGPWIMLFLSLGFWGAESYGIIGTNFGIWAIYASLAALVLTQGRKEKSWLLKPLKGVMSLYDSVGYFSDILSYSRLLALGLATSALAFAVNLIAQIIGDMLPPLVGGVVAVVILIVGHLFNLMVNALGAFIHSARLQFVEFFGKFIEGSGREFKPFARQERNVILEDK